MTMTKRQRVLFLCTGNSARSQMAEGLLRHFAGDQFEVFSAGTRPVGLNPNAVTAMSEIGINIAGSRSKSVDEFAGPTVRLCLHRLRQRKGIVPDISRWREASSIRVLKTLPLPRRISSSQSSGKCGIRLLIDCGSS